MKKYMLKDLKRYLRKEKEENERHLLYRRKSPRVSKCTKNCAELVQFATVLPCLNVNIISSGSIK